MPFRPVGLLAVLAAAAVTSPLAPGAAGAQPADPPLIPVAAAPRLLGSGDTVRVAGRLSSSTQVYTRRATYVALQDGGHGLWLFARGPVPVARTGDSVVATGVVQNYRGTTELVLGTLEVISTPPQLPEPASARADAGTPAGEREGRLLRVAGVAGEQGVSEGGRWLRLHPMAPGEPEASAVRRGDSITVWVPATHTDAPRLEDVRPGDVLDVVGVGGVYQDNPGDPAVAQLLPRSPADVRIVGIPGRWTELAVVWLSALASGVLVVMIAARVLTRRHAQAARETEARYRQLLTLCPDAVLVHAAGEILFANPAAARLLGLADERVLAGRALGDFADTTARGELEIAQRGDGRRARTRFIGADGAAADVEVAASACRYHDRPAVVIVARDIGAQLRYERELRELALLDELTGLHNRRGFLTFAEAELRRLRRMGHGAVLVFADLDGLKAINDQHGHAAGDVALCAVARGLRELVGAQGLVARWSGDEFVALIPQLDDEVTTGGGPSILDLTPCEARDAAAAERMELRLAEALRRQLTPGYALSISASIGVRHLPSDGGETLASSLEAADAGLYRRRAQVRQR